MESLRDQGNNCWNLHADQGIPSTNLVSTKWPVRLLWPWDFTLFCRVTQPSEHESYCKPVYLTYEMGAVLFLNVHPTFLTSSIGLPFRPWTINNISCDSLPRPLLKDLVWNVRLNFVGNGSTLPPTKRSKTCCWFQAPQSSCLNNSPGFS